MSGAYLAELNRAQQRELLGRLAQRGTNGTWPFDIAHLPFSRSHGYRFYRDSADGLRALDDQLTTAFRNELL